MTNENIKKDKKDKKIKILNQGTYGCIFKPGLTCEGMVDNSVRNITKLQRKKETSENEVEIGKKLMDIKQYKRHFAPIVESCDVDISKVIDNEFRKCKFIDENEKANKSLSFEINKISYIGKETLMTYTFNLLKKENALEFSKMFINNFKILIKGVEKMSNVNIVHFDVKENNIMTRKQTGRPIFIDFGLSFDMEEVRLDENNYFDVFYVYEPSYAPWCFEINMINYILNEIGKDMETVEDIVNLHVSGSQIDTFISDFFDSNTVFKNVLEEKEILQMKYNYSDYLKELVRKNSSATGIKWQVIFEEMFTYFKTWDVYGVCMCYLYMFPDLSLNELEVEHIKSFKSFLKSMIMSTPEKRLDAKKCLVELEKLNKVSGLDIENLQQTLIKRRENIEEIRKKYIDSKLKHDDEKVNK
tara:strand:- start:884 stop:2128 length:1245 start_codon:yes stop_codon:yes gene_type:complete